METKFGRILKKAPFILLFSLIYLGVGCIAAALISNLSPLEFQDVLFYEGVILILLGAFMSMKANPSGINLNGINQINSNEISYTSLETTRMEREMNPYEKDYFKNNVIELFTGSLAFIFGGIFLVACSAILVLTS